ncbi:MAG: rhodanese-like domain-containing protein [Trueperaceae bacterium]|nr:rhodanese-like domain-containing protein [Trueperaceae bacterium]
MNQTPEIDIHEAKKRIDAGDLLLDVREQDEYDEAHIPGSTLIPLSEFANRYDEVPQDREVVVYCRSGKRSAQAVNFLNDKGYDAINVEGGILAWQEADYPTE